jgi:hypothetical protein
MTPFDMFGFLVDLRREFFQISDLKLWQIF